MQRSLSTLYFQSIGEIVFQKDARSRKIRISVKPNRGVLVTYPTYISINEAYRFAEENTEWIRRNVDKAKLHENNRVVYKPGVSFSTREHCLQFIQESDQTKDPAMRIKIGKGFISVHYFLEDQLLSENGQGLIRKGIVYALRNEAKKILPERINYLSKLHNLPYCDLRIKDLKSRWGSCSSRNNINLNLHLVRLPDHLIDYVILHELAHTREKNHGKGFWKLLDSFTGDAKGLAKEMKEFRTQTY